MADIYGVDENGFLTVIEEESQVNEESVVESPAVDETLPLPSEPVENGDPASALEPSVAPEAVEVQEDFVVPYFADPADIADASVDALASGDPFDCDGMVIYKVTLSTYGDCSIVLTPDQAEHVTVEAGQLVNWWSSNITAPLFRGDPAERNAQSSLMITLLGRGNTGYPNNLYRNGSSQYVTYYYVNGSSLSSTNAYVALSDAEQVSYSRSYWIGVVILVCLIIMAVNGLIRFLRRGHRG